MKYVFVINPIAGKRKVQKEFSRAVNKYFSNSNLSYQIYYTKSRGDAQRFVHDLALTGEELRIYACGGEGTTFEVLNGSVGFDNISIGVVPCGSANDFVTYFSEKELFLDVASQVAGEEITIDLIKVGKYYAMNSCSVGMDAMVASNMAKFKQWPFVSGSMAYLLSLIFTMFGKLGVDLTVSVNSAKTVIKRKALFAVIANAPYYGGGFYPAPSAVPFDGKLDYSVISAVSRFKILSLLKTYRAGTHIGRDFCAYGSCVDMEVISDRRIPLNMDGEIIFTDHAKFEIAKKACRLILPKTISNVWKKKYEMLEKSKAPQKEFAKA